MYTKLINLITAQLLIQIKCHPISGVFGHHGVSAVARAEEGSR